MHYTKKDDSKDQTFLYDENRVNLYLYFICPVNKKVPLRHLLTIPSLLYIFPCNEWVRYSEKL